MFFILCGTKMGKNLIELCGMRLLFKIPATVFHSGEQAFGRHALLLA
jgi:hypothetical protein